MEEATLGRGAGFVSDDVVVAPSDGDPDWALLARVADGDESAFTTLVERHQRRLLSVCERLLGDPELARDAVQEVFLKMYRKAGRFQPQARVSTWLYRIAVNHCLNRLRRRKLVRWISLAGDSEDEGRPLDPPQEGAGPEEQALLRERWRRTRAAIDRLPESQRAVLILARFEGLSYRQISDTLGISFGAVESRLFRAMRNLEKASAED